MSKLGLAATFSKTVYAVFFAALAVIIAIHFSELYYAVAPFHYDSGFYLYQALQSYDGVLDNGRLQIALQIIRLNKDFLDLLLRVLIFPASLQMTYGHLVVALPFMILFNFLLLHYVIKRTHSFWSGLLVISFLFCFSFIYMPYQGLADYWKESVAIWILGCAFLSLLLSDYLKNWRYSLLSGVLFGLLIMERTGLAVYAALLLLPIFLKAAYKRLYCEPSKTHFLNISLFVLPAGAMCIFVGLMEWSLLYQYYFLKGYDYTSSFHVAKILIWSVVHFKWQLLPMITLTLLSAFCFLSSSCFRKQTHDTFLALWLVIGFPLMISLTHGIYNGFYSSWYVLLIIFFATMVPIQLKSNINRLTFNIIISTIIIVSIIAQYYLINQNRLYLMEKFSGWRVFYDELINTVIKEKKPRYFSLLIDEGFALFYDHAQFNRHIALNEMNVIGFSSVHDSYYKAEFSDKTNNPHQLAYDIIQSLEARAKDNSVLTIAYCDPNEIKQSAAFGMDSQKVAIPVNMEETRYLNNSLHWQAIKKLNSPNGCVYVYRYSHLNLTHTQKWQNVT